jgi:hypothetical protein
MSLIKANAVQIGQSPTATQNFTLAVPSSPDGTIKLARGNAGATTQDVINVSNAGVVSFPQGLGNISNSTAIATGSTTARSLANRFADVVNVKDFGAVGDGVADDTAAIQAAFNFIPASGGEVIIPKGTYILSSTLNISNKPISIFGAGIGISILKWTGVGMVGQNGINYTNTAFQPFLMEDLSLKAFPNPSDITQVAGTALSFVYPSLETVLETTVKLSRVEIRAEISGGIQQGGWTTSVYAKDAGRFHAIACNFAGVKKLGIKGIYLATGFNAFFPVINNCDFTAFEDAIYSTGPSSPGGTVIESNNFTGCYRGITIETPTDLIQITSNYFQIYKYGIYAKARTSIITGNRVDGVDEPFSIHAPSDLFGVQIDGTGSGPYDGGIISNNNFGRVSTEPMDGIILNGSAVGTSVTGNTVGTTSGYGTSLRYGIFLLNGATRNTVKDNNGIATTILVYDGSTGNIVKDNNVQTGSGMYPITGAIPYLASGAFGQTLNNICYLTQPSATNVTNITNGFDGQTITIVAGDSNSTIIGGGSTIILKTATFAMSGNNTLTLIYDGNVWREISRTP